LEHTEVVVDYAAEHWGSDDAMMLAQVLPPITESALNFTLSCITCNTTKRARILEPLVLVELLRSARDNFHMLQLQLGIE